MKKINYLVSIIALLCVMTGILSACSKSKDAERTIVVLIDPITGNEFEENKDFTVKNYPAEQLQGKKIQYKVKIKKSGKEITNKDLDYISLNEYMEIRLKNSDTGKYVNDTEYWPIIPGRYSIIVEFDMLDKSGGRGVKYGGSEFSTVFNII